MRFNPPPNWPVAAGWTPEPGWTPDPSWPPAPAGWQFWIDDFATAQAAPSPTDPYRATQPAYQGAPQWQPSPAVPGPIGPAPGGTNRNVLIWAGVGAVVLVIALAVVLFVVFGGNSSDSTAKAASDEDQLRTVVSSLESSWNTSDYAGFVGHTCTNVHGQLAKSDFNTWRNEGGTVKFAVTSIKVNGDSAVVEVTETFSKQGKLDEKLEFKKESGEWKMCGGVKT